MKRMAILASIVGAGLVATGLSAQGLPGIEPIEQVSDNVYKIFGAGGNTTVFVRSDGVALVDTKLANNGEAILEQVRKITDKPVTLIINTHSHPDHMGSNAEIHAKGNVRIVAHANSVRRMAAMPNTPPSERFDGTMTLGTGADQIDLHYFGAAHTDGDAFIVFPAEKTLLVGDVMAWDMGPLIDPMSGGSMVATPETVGKAAATITGIDKVVEGHGHVNTWDGFLRYLAYTQKVVEVAKKAVAEDLDYVQAYDKYFATDSAMAAYTSEEIKPGLEYGGTPKSRSYNNIYVAIMELRGEDVPLIMGAPPPPGSPPPAPRGAGGPGGQGARGPAGTPPPGAPGAGSQPPPGAVPTPSEHANHANHN
jgi:glyoxylase-like metal-dependent hydrolase (beta-lactamase superfamily II)